MSKVKYNSRIAKFFKRYVLDGLIAVTIWPYIFTPDNRKLSLSTINHELIHIRQQGELLFFFFFILYWGDYLRLRLKGLKHVEAYYYICFEQEAYQNEFDPDYLKSRKPMSWAKYLKK